MEVLLTKDGRFVVSEHNEQDEVVTTSKSALYAWYSVLTVEEGTTLGSLVEAVRKISDVEVLNPLCCTDITLFLKEAENPGKGFNPEDQIEYAELYWCPVVKRRWVTKQGKTGWKAGKRKGDFTGAQVLEDRPDFHGIGKTWEEGSGNQYSISLTPISDMLHYPLKLNRQYRVHDDNKRIEQLKGELDAGELSYLLDCEKDFTLGDVIYGIFWELGFYGGPEKRDEFAQELIDQHARILSGQEKFFSAEEVLAQMREEADEEDCNQSESEEG